MDISSKTFSQRTGIWLAAHIYFQPFTLLQRGAVAIMFVGLTKKHFFPSDASPKDVRISGAIFLIVAISIGGVMFAALMTIGQMNFMPILLWLPFVLWLVGTHRILWGGTTAVNRWLSMGRVAATAVAGFISLWIVSGLTGALVAIVNKMAA